MTVRIDLAAEDHVQSLLDGLSEPTELLEETQWVTAVGVACSGLSYV